MTAAAAPELAEAVCPVCSKPFIPGEAWQTLCVACWRLSRSIGTRPAPAGDLVARLVARIAVLESANADLRLAGTVIPEAMLWDLLDLCDPARHEGDLVAIGAVAWLHDQRRGGA
jgi:hypothetical protein